MEKILITGSQGYIGTVMTDYLLNQGYNVVGLDSGFFKESHLYDGLKESITIQKDTRHLTPEDLKGYDIVISLADLSNDPMGQIDQTLTFDINHKGVMHLAKLAKEAGVKRFIYSSSCSAYGVATSDMVDETSPTNPQTAYARCKVLCEQDLQMLSSSTFTTVFMRNATVYGASPRLRFDLVVNNLSGIAYTSGLIKLSSDGTPWRPLVHILDVVEAFAAVIKAPRELVHNQIFNVGNNNNNYQIRHVAEIIATVFPGCKTEFGTLDGDTRSYKVNFNKINTLLPGYKSLRTVKDGAQELKTMFEQVKLSKDIFESKDYTRLKQINFLKQNGLLDTALHWTT